MSVDYRSLRVFTLATLQKAESKKVKINGSGDKKTIIKMKDVSRRSYGYISPELPLIEKPAEEVEKQLAEVDIWYKARIAKATNDQEKTLVRKEKKRRIKRAKGPYTPAELNTKMTAKWSESQGQLAKQYLKASINEILKQMNDDIPQSREAALIAQQPGASVESEGKK